MLINELTELSDNWRYILSKVEENEGVLLDEDIQQYQKLEDDVSVLMGKLIGIRKLYDMQISACSDEQKRLAGRKQTWENKKESIENLTKMFLKRLSNSKTSSGGAKFAGATFSISEVNKKEPEIIIRD